MTFEGTYDPALQLLVPMEDGQFRVLTGLRQADGSVLAVVRGVVTDPSAPAPPSGLVATGRRAATYRRTCARSGFADAARLPPSACRPWRNSGPGR